MSDDPERYHNILEALRQTEEMQTLTRRLMDSAIQGFGSMVAAVQNANEKLGKQVDELQNSFKAFQHEQADILKTQVSDVERRAGIEAKLSTIETSMAVDLVERKYRQRSQDTFQRGIVVLMLVLIALVVWLLWKVSI